MKYLVITLLTLINLCSFNSRAQDEVLTSTSLNQKDSVFTFPDIQWISSTYEINSDWSAESKKNLDEIAAIIISNPTVKFEIRHHTQVRGTAEANMEISIQKIKSVKELLIHRDVKSEQFTCKAFGETYPLNAEMEINKYKTKDRQKFEILHWQNSRIELIIIK